MPQMIKERRAYIVLVLICMAMCGAFLILSIQSSKSETKKFCQVLVIQTQYPVPSPTSTGDPEVVKAYRVYQGRVKLAVQLGC